MILYEHPFNERVRTYLRLEYLFRRFELLLQRDHPADHHFCFSTVFEIVDVGGRADLKSDVLKDLERHKQQFQSYRGNPSVAEAVLVGCHQRFIVGHRAHILQRDVAELRPSHVSLQRSKRMRTRFERKDAPACTDQRPTTEMPERFTSGCENVTRVSHDGLLVPVIRTQ